MSTNIISRTLAFIGFILFINTCFAQKLAYDREIGKAYSKQVEQMIGVYEDEAMNAYLNQIGQRLVAAMDEPLFDYSFKILATPTPNAFALPGGFTYVTTGLLPILESEDELACIMAHEIIHANNRHSVKSMKKGILPAILQIPGNIVGVFSPGAGEMINRPIKGFGDLGMASYSRKNETEADVEGIKIASKAGYDPNALKSALTRLGAYIEVLTGEAEEKGYLDDHPMTVDRVTRLDKEISKITYSVSEPFNNEFNSGIAGVIYGENPANGILQDSVFYHPELSFKTIVPDKWISQSQPGALGMMNSTEDATLYISYEKNDSTPEQMAKTVYNQLSSQYKDMLVINQKVNIDGKEGYMLAFEQTDPNNSIYAYVLYMKIDGTLFEYSAMARPKWRSAIEKIPYSLSALSAADKKKIKIERVELTRTEANESFESLTKRTSNILSPALTALINDKKTNDKLEEGLKVKIVLEEPYFK